MEGTDAGELLSVVPFAYVLRVVFFAEEFECELDTFAAACKYWYSGLYVCVFQRAIDANRTELFSAGWEAETSASHGVSGLYSVFQVGDPRVRGWSVHVNLC